MDNKELVEDLHSLLTLIHTRGAGSPAEKRRLAFTKQNKLDRISDLAHKQAAHAEELHQAAQQAHAQGHPQAQKIQKNASTAMQYAMQGHAKAAEISKTAGDHAREKLHMQHHDALAAKHSMNFGQHAQQPQHPQPQQHGSHPQGHPFQAPDPAHAPPKPSNPPKRYSGMPVARGQQDLPPGSRHKSVARALGKKYVQNNPAERHMAKVQAAYRTHKRGFPPSP